MKPFQSYQQSHQFIIAHRADVPSVALPYCHGGLAKLRDVNYPSLRARHRAVALKSCEAVSERA